MPAVMVFTSIFLILAVSATLDANPDQIYVGGLACVAFMLALAAFPFQHAAVDPVAKPLLAKAGFCMFIGTFSCALALGVLWSGFVLIASIHNTEWNRAILRSVVAILSLLIGGFGVLTWNVGAWNYLQFAIEAAKADTKVAISKDEEDLQIILDHYRQLFAEDRKAEALARLDRRLHKTKVPASQEAD